MLLDRVTALGRVIFTRDVDFLAHARERQRTGVTFSGVVYVSWEFQQAMTDSQTYTRTREW